MAGAYDCWLVALSVLIAICASYAALRLGSRTTAAQGQTRLVWVVGGGIAMGFGIWSMHYVGMLAFHLPIQVRYHLPTVIASLLAAVFASGVALFVVSRKEWRILNASVGSLFMGAGIVTMHYTGMAAMRMRAMCHYDPALVALSCVVAAGGSLGALWLTFHHRTPTSSDSIAKILSAAVMGMAIAAMHYIGMAAASFHYSAVPADFSSAVTVSSLGVTGILIVTFLVLGFAVFTSGIDQRLAAHRALAEELHQSRQMLRSVLDNIPDRVLWRSRQGRYLGCNQAFALDAGLASPEEIVGKTDADLASQPCCAQYISDLTAVASGKPPILHAEYETSDPNGRQRWFRGNSIPLRDLNGNVYGVLGSYQDITEQKQAEEAVKRSNAALSEFAHVVSHDLQTPLRGVKVYIQLLERNYREKLDAQGHKLLSIIEDGATAMEDLIRSLLSYASATDHEPAGRTTVSLETALERAISNLKSLIDEAAAEISFEALPAVFGYSAQLVQVFQNLISNAIKYRKQDVTPRVHVSAHKNSKFWVICIQDNGLGIARQDQQRIFAPLKRLHGKEIPGYGIGLATCRKVVEHHGGQLWVESEPGVGSRFCFSIAEMYAPEPAEAAAT